MKSTLDDRNLVVIYLTDAKPIAPEVLSNRGYDGGASDTWPCGVIQLILYAMLTVYLPFDDRNLALIYQKVKMHIVVIFIDSLML